MFPFGDPLITGNLTLSDITFPRYPLNDPNEIPGLLALFERDVRNSYGEDISAAEHGTLVIG